MGRGSPAGSGAQRLRPPIEPALARDAARLPPDSPCHTPRSSVESYVLYQHVLPYRAGEWSKNTNSARSGIWNQPLHCSSCTRVTRAVAKGHTAPGFERGRDRRPRRPLDRDNSRPTAVGAQMVVPFGDVRAVQLLSERLPNDHRLLDGGHPRAGPPRVGLRGRDARPQWGARRVPDEDVLGALPGDHGGQPPVLQPGEQPQQLGPDQGRPAAESSEQRLQAVDGDPFRTNLVHSEGHPTTSSIRPIMSAMLVVAELTGSYVATGLPVRSFTINPRTRMADRSPILPW